MAMARPTLRPAPVTSAVAAAPGWFMNWSKRFGFEGEFALGLAI
jgi:hypothetical protein